MRSSGCVAPQREGPRDHMSSTDTKCHMIFLCHTTVAFFWYFPTFKSCENPPYGHQPSAVRPQVGTGPGPQLSSPCPARALRPCPLGRSYTVAARRLGLFSLYVLHASSVCLHATNSLLFTLFHHRKKSLIPDSCMGTVNKGGITQVPGHPPARKWLRLDPEGVSRQTPGAPPGGERLRTFTGEPVGRDPGQGLSAHVAVGGPGVRAGVPVVCP